MKKAESPFIALAMLVVGYLLSIASTAVLLLGSSRLKTDTYGLVINAALKSEVSDRALAHLWLNGPLSR